MRCNVPRGFVGIALPGEVRWALARKYPWLEKHFIEAQVELKEQLQIQSKQGALMPVTASYLVIDLTVNV